MATNDTLTELIARDFQSGMTMDDIATERKLLRDTVERHVRRWMLRASTGMSTRL